MVAKKNARRSTVQIGGAEMDTLDRVKEGTGLSRAGVVRLLIRRLGEGEIRLRL
jgi:hypothetical protein